MIIGKCGDLNVFCNLRENVHVNFPGCPYNRPEWEENILNTLKKRE
jgi:hypothetical protein